MDFIEQIIKSLASNRPMQTFFPPEMRKQMEDAQRNIQKFLEPFERLSQEVQKTIEPFKAIALHNQRLLGKLGRQIAMFMELAEKFNQHVDSIHEKDRVFLPPCLAKAPVDEVARLLAQPNKSALEIYQGFFSKRENIDALLENWKKNPLFEERWEILRDALYSHTEGRFTVSVPPLVAQIDGILQRQLGVAKHNKFKKQMKKLARKPATKKNDWLNGSNSIEQIICGEIFEQTNLLKKKNDTKYPNRHPILHGNNLDYHRTYEASLRCILVLDFLSSSDFQDLLKSEGTGVLKPEDSSRRAST